MTDTRSELQRLADDLTRSCRRFDDAGGKNGATRLAAILRDFAGRQSLPDEDVIITFVGAAKKLLKRSQLLI